MQIGIEWLPEIDLVRTRLKLSVSYEMATAACDPPPASPGIYVFARQARNRVEALYVGKAENLQKRIRTQLNNLKLMNHVAESGLGRKFIVCGAMTRLNELHLPKRLDLAERAFIRHFLEDGHPLVNEMGSRLVSHTIKFSGNRKIFGLGKEMYIP